jgi:hypothetical protein
MSIVDILILMAALLGVITIIGAIALSEGRKSITETFAFERTRTRHR